MIMSEIFARYLEAGIFGSVIILLVLVLRLCLRKAPRRILCLLWLLAAVRLLLPFQLESRLSLQPDLDNVAVVMGQEQDAPVTNVVLPDELVSVPEKEPAYQPQTQPIADAEKQHKNPIDTMGLLSVIWVSVACSAVIYMIVSYMILKFRVREAVRCEDGVMECGRIRGAFLLGYLRPKIYLPFRVSSTDRKFIIAHERAHIARGDNWWKLLGFLCASVHWYNPLVWLSYVLLCRDIELACDEKVIRDLNTDERKGYSMALLNCGKSLSGASICPVAFGEVSLKTRIKSILHYRKPGVWITVIAFVLITATAICFLTSPMAEALPVETPEKETEALQTEQTTEASEPETSQATAQETEPETTTHVHNYTVQTVAPTCTSGGYDRHICTCGDEYTDNPVNASGHQYYWAEADYSENQMLVKCANCTSSYWEKVPLNYDDTGSITQRLESYASAYGFRISTEDNMSNATCFSYSAGPSEIDDVNSEPFVAAGKKIVNEAYEYCIANNLKVSEQMCYIDVHYTATGYGLPKTQLTTAPQMPSVQWDLSGNNNPHSIATGYLGGAGTTSSSVTVTKYYINVYIAPIPKESPEEKQENKLDTNIGDMTENTEPSSPIETEPAIEATVPETTEPTVEPTVPETTEPPETLPAEEECLTGLPGLEDTTEPIRENDVLPLE